MAKQSNQKQELSRALIKDEDKNAIATMIRQEVQQYSGPLPHPDMMRGYEELLPGSADRILTMAEKEEDHRHEMEKNFLEMEFRDSLLGILFAFILSAGFLLSGVLIIFLVEGVAATVAGTIFGTSGFAGVVISMIKYTRRNVKIEENDKSGEE